MSRSRFVTTAAAGLAAFLGMLVVAQTSTDKDYTALPPKPSEVQQQLDAIKIGLAQAVDIAQKAVNGKAGSAKVDLKKTPAVFEVVVYAGGKAHRVIVNGDTGAVDSKEVAPYLPGAAFDGDLVAKESGVQIADLKVGEGAEVTESTGVVQVNVVGYLVDGSEIINTTKTPSPEIQPEPVALPLRQMFPGFIEGVQGMKVGGKRKILMPPAMAYGERGNPPAIPANATLIFDIEMLGVDPFSKVPSKAELPGEPVGDLEMVTTPSGLMYYDLHCGEGEQPSGPTAQVKVHYTGYLVNGEEFDSSRDKPEPFATPLNRVIAGWTEGVQSMKVGGKRKLIVPYNLAYGEGGMPGRIPPQATLVFDIELIETSDAPPAPSPAMPRTPGASSQPGRPRVDHDHDGDGKPDH